MITNYANKTVKLVELMKNEEAKNALNNSLSTYPLYKGKKDYDLIPTREELNEKLLNHYKYYEIGFETVGRFLDELKITMCEVMPYYNEMFKSIEIMADLENPFDNVDVVETFEEQRNDSVMTEGESTNNASGTNTTTSSDSRSTNTTTDADTTTTKKTKFSDTPQNSINNINNYLTTYTEEENTANTHGTDDQTTEGSGTSETTGTSESKVSNTGISESEGTTRHTFTKKGNQGVNTYAHDMNEFRTTIIDVVEKIINNNRIANLFMLIW